MLIILSGSESIVIEFANTIQMTSLGMFEIYVKAITDHQSNCSYVGYQLLFY